MVEANSVLVTGGAGFIGSHLCERLIKDGKSVTVIDNLATGSVENIRHLEGNDRFRWIVGSACESGLVDQEVARCQIVYHLASAVGVRLVVNDPVGTIENVFQTTDTVLKSCARYRRPVVITSTSEVYGKSEKVPFREDQDVVMGPTCKRRWAYAFAKALDEFLALALFRTTGLPVFIVRLFNTVGPRQTSRYGMVLPAFVERALDNQPLLVYGDGNQKRCFCHVDDVVRALVKLPTQKSAVGTVINVGSQSEISILNLAKLVIKECKSNSSINFVPYESVFGDHFDDMMRRVPDLSRAQELLKWRPRKTIRQTIASVITHVQNRPKTISS